MPSPTSSSTATTYSSRSGDIRIDAVMTGTKWGGPIKQGVTLSYSFPGKSSNVSHWDNDYPNNIPFNGLQYFTSADQAAVKQALKVISTYANIKFVEVSDTSSSVGDIRFTKTNYSEGSEPAFAYTPARTPEAGDVWFVNGNFSTMAVGSIGFGTLLHEIGHAVGLSHPFEGYPQLPAPIDWVANTVMSYTGSLVGTVSLMPFDIASLQYIYGKNTSFNSGNTTYTASTINALFGVDPNAGTGTGGGFNYFATLYDAGGIDTFVAANYANLNPWEGGVSYTYGRETSFGAILAYPRTVSVKIAIGTVIENATLTYANGTIVGNNVANVLKGKTSGTLQNTAGVQIDGFGGNDTLYSDRVIATGYSPGGGGGYERNQLYGNSGNDKLYGWNYGDNLFGGSGSDYLFGGAGADALSGGSGLDTADYTGSSAGISLTLVDWVSTRTIAEFDDNNPPDRVGHLIFQVVDGDFTYGSGGDADGDVLVGIENLIGSSYSDYLFGNSMPNVFNGAAGDDTMYGQSGNDTLVGGAGNDFMHGGSGSDTASYAGGGTVTVNLANTTQQNTGGQGYDTLIDIENIIGSSFHDTITGNALGNVLSGERGNDRIIGGAGNDTIIGGIGRDLMSGGSGKDIFDFNAANETGLTSSTYDVITDFKHLEDDINLQTIDASSILAGNNAFVWRSTGAFTTSTSGELRYKIFNNAGTSNDYTMIYGDTDGDTAAEFQIKLTGLVTLTSSDFVF